MKIYTSYFDNMSNLTEKHVPVSISLIPPEWYDGASIPELAPNQSILHEYRHGPMDAAAMELYKTRFEQEVLLGLDWADVVRKLEVIADGKDVILLCYEAPGLFCHRHLVAEKLKQLGFEVEEY